MPINRWFLIGKQGRDRVENVRHRDFFQFIRTLMHFGGEDILQNKSVVLNCSGDLSFPSSDFSEKNFQKEIQTLELNFMGLLGVDSCMPAFFNDLLNSHDLNAQRLKSFLDIFHHRIYELFFKVWKNNQPDIQLEFGEQTWLNMLDKLMPRLDVQNDSLELGQYFIGHKRTLGALKNILSIKLPDVPFIINTMKPCWSALANDNRLGDSELELGSNTLLGGRYLNGSQEIGIQFGPITSQMFLSIKCQKKSLQDLLKNYMSGFQRIHFSALISHQATQQSLGSCSMILGQTILLGNKQSVIAQEM